MAMYVVSVSKFDYDKGKVTEKYIQTMEGKSVADVRKKLLRKNSEPGLEFSIYDPTEYTKDPYTVKYNGKLITLGVKKGECHIYLNGIFWFTYNEKTKVAKKYKLNKDGSLNGTRKW